MVEGLGVRPLVVEISNGKVRLPFSNVSVDDEEVLKLGINGLVGKDLARRIWRQFKEAQADEMVAAGTQTGAPSLDYGKFTIFTHARPLVVEISDGVLRLPLSNFSDDDEEVLKKGINDLFSKKVARRIWRQFNTAMANEMVEARTQYGAPFLECGKFTITVLDAGE